MPHWCRSERFHLIWCVHYQTKMHSEVRSNQGVVIATLEGQMCNAFRKKLFLWLSLQTHAAFKHGFATWQQCHLATLHFNHSPANRYCESIVSSGGDICWYWWVYLDKSVDSYTHHRSSNLIIQFELVHPSHPGTPRPFASVRGQGWCWR